MAESTVGVALSPMDSGHTVTCGWTPIRPFRLGFGCSPLMSRVSRRDSARALAAALDHGINYFDVARAYGYGEAEAIVGEVLQGRRDRVVIATKFGIVPPRPDPLRRLAKRVLRPVFNRLPGLRKAAAPALGRQMAHGHFSPAEMLESVEQSLRALRTDHIDVLLVHECSPGALNDDALFEALDRLVVAGKARTCGITASPEVILQAYGMPQRKLGLVQFRYGLLDQAATSVLRGGGRELIRVAHSPFSGGGSFGRLAERLAAMADDDRLPAPLREKLAARDKAIIVNAVLNAPLRGTGVDILLSTMVDVRQLAANVAAVCSPLFTPEELALLRAGFR